MITVAKMKTAEEEKNHQLARAAEKRKHVYTIQATLYSLVEKHSFFVQLLSVLLSGHTQMEKAIISSICDLERKLEKNEIMLQLLVVDTSMKNNCTTYNTMNKDVHTHLEL